MANDATSTTTTSATQPSITFTSKRSARPATTDERAIDAMSDRSSIEWTQATWNPTRGCRRTAPAGSKQSGCGDASGGGCYAERTAARFCGPGQPYEGLITLTANGPRWSGATKFVERHLYDPLRWQKPRRIFVDSMSDLFYDGFTDDQRDQVLAVMLLAPYHTFQVLTKRAAVMRRYLSDPRLYERVLRAANKVRDLFPRMRLTQVGVADPATAPASWIWWGVSVENQAAADERIPELLATPAAVRWISAEPLLGPVRLDHMDVDRYGHKDWCQIDALAGRHTDMGRPCPDVPHLNWIVAGCESGPGARPCDVAWLRSLRDQCAAAGVPYFVKQAVAVYDDGDREDPREVGYQSGPALPGIQWGPGSHRKAGGVIGLPYLDGVQHAAIPEVPRG